MMIIIIVAYPFGHTSLVFCCCCCCCCWVSIEVLYTRIYTLQSLTAAAPVPLWRLVKAGGIWLTYDNRLMSVSEWMNGLRYRIGEEVRSWCEKSAPPPLSIPQWALVCLLLCSFAHCLWALTPWLPVYCIECPDWRPCIHRTCTQMITVVQWHHHTNGGFQPRGE